MLRPAPVCAAVAAVFVVTFAPPRATAQVVVRDVIGRMPLIEYNAFIAPQSYRDWGNEPFVAVNPANTNQLVVSGFGYGSNSSSFGASLWTSNDGGANFSMYFPIPGGPGNTQVPRDQTYSYDAGGTLHGTLLASSGSNQFVYHGSTTNPSQDVPSSGWTWTNQNISASTGSSPDQPWMTVRGAGATAKVFVAYDNFNSSFTTVEQRVAVSTDGGATFGAPVAVSAGGRQSTTTNPGLRITADAAGSKVYSIFGIGTSSAGGVQNVNYRLNESIDGGATWRYTNATTNPGGLAIDSGSSAQIGSLFGGKNELRGNTTAIAVSDSGDHVYTVYGKRDGNGIDQLFVREFHPTSTLDVTSDLVGSLAVRVSPAAEPAALPKITVLGSGKVVVMFDSFAGGLFHTHVAKSSDFGATWVDQEVYSWNPSFLDGSGNLGGTRPLGDYGYLTSVGESWWGVFAGGGFTNADGINTTGLITPIVVSEITPVPEPTAVTLVGLLAVVGGAGVRRVRRAVAA